MAREAVNAFYLVLDGFLNFVKQMASEWHFMLILNILYTYILVAYDGQLPICGNILDIGTMTKHVVSRRG